ncbi:hypothetical protein CVT26_013062 [Gymnopilus dilepis]|uniref:Uncharacterized protein n=1 Tax=Gymnopilus dilepis TaxID=231916 RepID=A0A409Y4I5_9AGAR|nr:hypothetical protein CVT26_013062 [Gymnopilus dilepis]
MKSLRRAPTSSSLGRLPSLLPSTRNSPQTAPSSTQQPIFYPLTKSGIGEGVSTLVNIPQIPALDGSQPTAYKLQFYSDKSPGTLLQGKNNPLPRRNGSSQKAPAPLFFPLGNSPPSRTSSAELNSSSTVPDNTPYSRQTGHHDSSESSNSPDEHSLTHAAPLSVNDPDLCMTREPGRVVVTRGHLEGQLLRPALSDGPSTTGRLSDEALEALQDGFAELDRVMQKIKGSTGLTPKQILDRWQPSLPRHLNFWNIYQKYFQTRPQEELKRLQKKGRPIGTFLLPSLQLWSALIPEDPSKVDTLTIRSAYRAFRKEEPNHKGILELFWRIHEIESSNTSLNGRYRDFRKYVNAMTRLAESASTINGFEIAFCAVGSVVQQDQSLSATFCSRMVPNFFLDRLHFSNDELEAHLKAHVYDYASRAAVVSRDKERLTVSMTAAEQHTDRTPHTGTKEPLDSTKKKGPLLKVLKDRIKKFLEPCNISQLQSSRFPFSDFPKILAQYGWIIENWPEDIPFPCDFQKGKGIARLGASHRDSLLKAFDDPQDPIKIVKKFPCAVPACEPVIIGIAPSPKSEYERGRRRFLDTNGTVDRNGPARRTGTSASANEPSRQNLRKRRVACEDPKANGKLKRQRKSGS